jgi:hypothetical protein
VQFPTFKKPDNQKHILQEEKEQEMDMDELELITS